MDSLITGNKGIVAFLYAPVLLHAPAADAMEILRRTDKKEWEKLESRLINEIFANARTWQISPYNCVYEGSQCVMVYNSLTNALARLDHDEYRQMSGKRHLKKDLRMRLLGNGFLLANVNASRMYEIYRAARCRTHDTLSINITATMRCNARCAYCYEAGARKGDFSRETLDQIIPFIKRQKPKRKLKLTWFGGEPLLGVTAMDHLCSGLKNEKIDFSSYIITNGSLITRQLLRENFPAWNIADAQITLDGGEATYAARKNYRRKKGNSFADILEKILWTAEAGIKVHIRLNIDKGNADEIIELLPILQKHFADNKNVVYYPAFLTGVGYCMSDAEKVAHVKKMYGAINDPTKFNIAERLYSTPRMMACMREDPYSFSIDTSGRVYPCEHLVGKGKETLGTVRRLSHERNMARCNPQLRGECRVCAYLPKCMGGCAENLKTGDACCLIERYMIAAYLEYLAD